MSEPELIRALQEVMARHARPPLEPRQLGAELMARDRARMRLLGGVTALLWLVGVAGVLYMVFCFNRFIVAYSPAGLNDGDHYGSTRAFDEFHAKMELHHSLEACMVAVPTLLLAALSTVWLVFSSRHATLTQINLGLAEISEQLRALRPPPRPPENGSTPAS